MELVSSDNHLHAFENINHFVCSILIVTLHLYKEYK